MQKLILGLVALVAVTAMTDSASARDRSYRVRNNGGYYTQQQVDYPQQQGGYYQDNSRQSFFGGLMDAERRKNAWLRQTFFGR